MFIAGDTLDFHNYNELTNYDIEDILYKFIEDSFVAGYEQILIITGKGRVVKPLVHKLLSKNKYIKSYKKAGYYNGQDGAVEVYLKDEI